MEAIIDKVLRTAVHLQECKAFLRSANPDNRAHGEECTIEYIELLREDLNAFIHQKEKETAAVE